MDSSSSSVGVGEKKKAEEDRDGMSQLDSLSLLMPCPAASDIWIMAAWLL